MKLTRPKKHEPKNCTSPTFESKKSNFTDLVVYPNPFYTSFFIDRIGLADEQFQVEVTDITGRTIYSDSFYKNDITKEVSIISYPPGLYLLRIRGSREFVSFKLIKSN